MQKPRQIHIPHTFILILSTHIPYTRGMQKPMHMHIPYTSKYILYTHINTLYTRGSQHFSFPTHQTNKQTAKTTNRKAGTMESCTYLVSKET